MMAISEAAQIDFYRAALSGLRFLDASGQARRFGADADARWASFAGHLGVRDRIDLSLRDAAVSWGAAFSPARVFSLLGLAPDEAFGPAWTGISEDVARKLWETTAHHVGVGAPQVDADLTTRLAEVVEALHLSPLASAPDLGALTPSTRLLVIGASAIVAVALAFARDDRLSFSDQVWVLADTPAERQLAGLSAVVIGARGPTQLLISEDLTTTEDLHGQGSARVFRVDRAIVVPEPDVAMAALIAQVVA